MSQNISWNWTNGFLFDTILSRGYCNSAFELLFLICDNSLLKLKKKKTRQRMAIKYIFSTFPTKHLHLKVFSYFHYWLSACGVPTSILLTEWPWSVLSKLFFHFWEYFLTRISHLTQIKTSLSLEISNNVNPNHRLSCLFYWTPFYLFLIYGNNVEKRIHFQIYFFLKIKKKKKKVWWFIYERDRNLTL